ncbi:MAG: PilZ domain-containing protein [Candidatus Eisenbacteria bacterium]|nr:PilZ domain-containing protein [Candidatus Eisenbacteria bacterium]MCC7142921.1 PilZ domain-containing protein [Candidatus Eisenbacteria bacterium]
MTQSAVLNQTQGWNRREFQRVALDLEAELQLTPETRVMGRTRDVSMKGFFLRCAERPDLGAPCSATVHFAGPESQLKVRAYGRIARTEPHGVGIEFTALESESFEHLKNLVVYNTPDPAGALAELAAHIGIKKRAA